MRSRPGVALPKTWSDSILRDVCLGVGKVDPIESGRDSFKYVDIGAIDNKTNYVRQLSPIPVKGAPSRARQLIQCGDTVFSTVRPYLRNIAWIDESLDGEVASTGFCVLRPNPAKVEARFLFYYSMSDFLLGQVLPLQRGVSYPAVRDGDLFNSEIGVPPLGEQAKIVEILEEQLARLDAVVKSVQTVREKAAEFRRALLQDAFNGALTNRLEGFQSEVLRGDWTSSTLREVCIGVTKVNPIDLGRDSFKYVDIGAIDSQTNQVRQLNPISVEGAPSRARQLIQCGDTIFSTVRPYLRNIAWIDESLDGEVASTGFCVLRPNPAKVEARFLFYFLMSDFLLGQVLPLQRGVSYPAVRDGDLFGSRITVPPLAEQEAIVKILEGQWSRLDSALLVADEVERKATALRRSLLHAAFSGELTRSWRESNV
jgi:type I restriction enzyme S subunit